MASVPESKVASSNAAAELNALIRTGKDAGASDIHLEPELPAAYRVSSGLVASKKHMSRDETLAISRVLLSEHQWQAFLKKGSADLARTVEGVRCRFNILETSRGVGLAIRLLASTVPTIETLNLHPSLKDLCGILPFHKDLRIRIPVCEVFRTTPGVKNDIRRAQYAQITDAMQMGAESGMWTFDRYGEWVAARSDWFIPSRGPHASAVEPSAS